MKYSYTILIILFVLPLHLCGQNELLLFSIEDFLGNRDSVFFGLDENATIGIDSSLGEYNILGQELDSLDLRIAQYDQFNHNCLKVSHFNQTPPSSFIYYSESVESKKNLRHYEYANPAISNFEFIINSNSYPISVKIEYVEGYPGNPHPFLFILDPDCNTIDNYQLQSYEPTQLTIEDSSINTLIIQYEFIVSNQNIINENIDWEIYPNPTSNTIRILFEENVSGDIIIRDFLGEVVLSDLLINSEEKEITLEKFSTGIYLLSFVNSNNSKIYTKRILVK